MQADAGMLTQPSHDAGLHNDVSLDAGLAPDMSGTDGGFHLSQPDGGLGDRGGCARDSFDHDGDFMTPCTPCAAPCGPNRDGIQSCDGSRDRVCTCKAGFTEDGDGECIKDNCYGVDCHGGNCVNLEESYLCECLLGFTVHFVRASGAHRRLAKMVVNAVSIT